MWVFAHGSFYNGGPLFCWHFKGSQKETGLFRATPVLKNTLLQTVSEENQDEDLFQIASPSVPLVTLARVLWLKEDPGPVVSPFATFPCVLVMSKVAFPPELTRIRDMCSYAFLS